MIFFQESENEILLKIRAVTNSKTAAIFGLDYDSLKIKVKAKPINNKANLQIIELLADIIAINKSEIQIKNGHKFNIKIISIPKNNKNLEKLQQILLSFSN